MVEVYDTKDKESGFYINSKTGMKVSVIGAGVVGQATGIGLSHHGNTVLFNDINKEKMSLLKKKGYRVTSQILEAVLDSDIIFVCVPTPSTNDHMDLSFIDSSIDVLAKALEESKKYVVIVFRSTILPQTTRTHLVPALEKKSGLKAGRDFGVCMNPEFLRERSSLNDFLNPSRIIIGQLDKKSGDILERLYSSFDCPIVRTDLDTAEMIKYASNLFLASKISFFNEFYMTCNRLGLDANTVSEAVSLDPRIGRYGIYGGTAFSGNCFPKDLKAFLSFAKSKSLNHKILNAVFEINQDIASFKSKKEK